MWFSHRRFQCKHAACRPIGIFSPLSPHHWATAQIVFVCNRIPRSLAGLHDPSHYLLCVFFFFNELLEFYTRKSLTLTVRFAIIKTTPATANVLLISIFMFAFGPLPYVFKQAHTHSHTIFIAVASRFLTSLSGMYQKAMVQDGAGGKCTYTYKCFPHYKYTLHSFAHSLTHTHTHYCTPTTLLFIIIITSYHQINIVCENVCVDYSRLHCVLDRIIIPFLV